MISQESKIIILGAGSIGERHIRNLLDAGYSDIIVYRQRNLPLRTVSPEKIKVVTYWEDVKKEEPKLAFITSPTAFHIDQAIDCAKLGAHLFIEKPIDSEIDETKIEILTNLVTRKKLHVQVGYMMRFYPLLERVKAFIKQQTYGQLISFHSHWGEYLPKWHPWENYKQSYAARKDLGGGVSVTLSHDLDVALWLSPSRLIKSYSLKESARIIDVDGVDGIAEFVLQFEDGLIGHVHLNFIQQIPERRYEFRFESAIVGIDFFKHSMSIQTVQESIHHHLDDSYDRNDLFADQLKDFLKRAASPDVDFSLNQVEHAKLVLEVAIQEACSKN